MSNKLREACAPLPACSNCAEREPLTGYCNRTKEITSALGWCQGHKDKAIQENMTERGLITTSIIREWLIAMAFNNTGDAEFCASCLEIADRLGELKEFAMVYQIGGGHITDNKALFVGMGDKK